MAEYQIIAIDRAAEVLEVLSGTDDPVSLVGLSRATRLNKTTLLRICCTLERRGLVERDDQARYQLGPMSYAMGRRYERNKKLAAVLAPAITSFALRIGESVSFQVRTSTHARTCIYRADGNPEMLVADVLSGAQLPLVEQGSTARVLLAYDGQPGDRYDDIRRRGYCLSFEERYRECVAITVPVMKSRDRLHGVISVLGPTSRFTRNYCQRLLPGLVATASHLSQSLDSARH